MKQDEHLLLILGEECAEVMQRVTKAMRFGLAEVQPEQPFTNAERILHEWYDAESALEMLIEAGLMPVISPAERREAINRKKAQVNKFLDYSIECGTLEEAQ